MNEFDKSGKITSEEKRKFIEVMETDDRRPKEEKKVIDNLMKEYNRAKVEGKRD